MPDGASLALLDNGPSRIQSYYSAIFDKDAPNFALFPPPEADPWIGFFSVEIPLGADINGNGENDKIKFTLGTITAGDENRTFIELPDGTVINEFDSGAFLEGAVVDESTDPPFVIGSLLPIGSQFPDGLPDPSVFGGPSQINGKVLNPVIPEPATLALLFLGGLVLLRRNRFGLRLAVY
jgi:hypothetical protein